MVDIAFLFSLTAFSLSRSDRKYARENFVTLSCVRTRARCENYSDIKAGNLRTRRIRFLLVLLLFLFFVLILFFFSSPMCVPCGKYSYSMQILSTDSSIICLLHARCPEVFFFDIFSACGRMLPRTSPRYLLELK